MLICGFCFPCNCLPFPSFLVHPVVYLYYFLTFNTILYTQGPAVTCIVSQYFSEGNLEEGIESAITKHCNCQEQREDSETLTCDY